MSGKYNIKNLVKVLRNPRKLNTAVNLIVGDIKNNVINNLEEYYYSNRYKNDEVDILDKDWDNLIILDACRYDVLQSIYPKEIEKITSIAGHSSEFIEKSMNGKELYDTVYISSNPYTDMTLDEGVFHKVIKTYSGTWERGQDHDHTKYHPENVYDIAKENIDKHPDKK